MKKWILLALFAVLLLPALAHAQFTHALTTSGASTLTCSSTGNGGTYATDIFVGTLTGNVTPTLPAAAADCADRSHIEIRATQGASAYTVTTGAGAGTALAVPSHFGQTIQLGVTAGNVLHQVWIYHKTLVTPTWELVTQETIPAPTAPVTPCKDTATLSDGTVTVDNACIPVGTSNPVVTLRDLTTPGATFSYSITTAGHITITLTSGGTPTDEVQWAIVG